MTTAAFNTPHMTAREERLPVLGSDDAAPLSRRYDAPTRLKQLPLICAVVGLLLAPLVLLAEFRSAQTPLVITDSTTLTAAGSAYELNADGTPNLLKECKELYFTQPLDHFVAKSPTYEERYFVCDKHARKNGAIFFYVGNEADVELYLNNTGLMWENAEEFGAMLVFAEHRYFGKSVPFGDDVDNNMQYLSTEQTLADYAVLIDHLKSSYSLDVPVIGFGGSYGGMLGSWFRMKYPSSIDGVIAASAPILAFLGDEKPVDTEAFARVTTFDASPAAGSSEQCIPNVRRAWTTMRDLGASASGRKQLMEAFSLCESENVETEDDVTALIEWAKSAFDYMAMGNFPYPSPYIMNGVSVLPAYPVRVACEHLADTFAQDDSVALLHAFRDAVGVYYNSTKDASCFQLSPPSNESARDGDFWQYLFCSELYMPQSQDGVNDMFWSVASNQTADDEACETQWGIHLRPKWAVTQYGGRKALRSASNIVFSNGNYDPWSGTGVLDTVSESVVYVPVDGGAHHVDLFFSNELDPPSVKQARETEKSHMWKWVKQYYAAKQAREAATA